MIYIEIFKNIKMNVAGMVLNENLTYCNILWILQDESTEHNVDLTQSIDAKSNVKQLKRFRMKTRIYKCQYMAPCILSVRHCNYYG